MTVYSPYTQANNLRRLCIVVRVAANPAAMIDRIRDAIQEVDASLPILEIDTADQQLDRALFRNRLVVRLAVVFAVVALLLASVGLFGVMSFITQKRTGEIGVRIALGASRGDVTRMILRQSLTLVSMGAVLGLAATAAARKLITSQLYGLEAGDPSTLAGITVAFFAVAVAATWIPARNAARVDPLVALRRD
jgi:putative ABC transport system permease protein